MFLVLVGHQVWYFVNNLISYHLHFAQWIIKNFIILHNSHLTITCVLRSIHQMLEKYKYWTWYGSPLAVLILIIFFIREWSCQEIRN